MSKFLDIRDWVNSRPPYSRLTIANMPHGDYILLSLWGRDAVNDDGTRVGRPAIEYSFSSWVASQARIGWRRVVAYQIRRMRGLTSGRGFWI